MSALLAFILRLSGAWELRDGADGATLAWFTDRTTAREAARLLALRTWRPMVIVRRGRAETVQPMG